MEIVQNQVSINLTMGSKQNTDFLAKFKFTLAIGQQQTKKLQNQYHFPYLLDDQLKLLLVFGCQLGKQSEFIDYIKSGTHKNIKQNTQSLSPLLKLIKNLGKQGTLTFKSLPGQVTIFYCLRSQDTQTMYYDLQYLQDLKIYAIVNGQMRGHAVHEHQNRIGLKIDYSQFHLISQKIIPQKIIKTIKDLDKQMSQQFDDQHHPMYPFNNPLMKLMGKTKKIKINLHTNSIRKIYNYFQKAKSADGNIKHQTKKFPYVLPNLLKSKAECTVFFKSNYGLNLSLNYQNEQIFFRLIKVFCIFIHKGFGLPI